MLHHSLSTHYVTYSSMIKAYIKNVLVLFFPLIEVRKWMKPSFTVIFSTVFCAACSDQSTSQFNTYQQRLSSTLDISLSQPKLISGETNSIELIRFPRTSETRVSIESNQINLLDFLKIFQCSLGNIVANKNSSLGRVAAPSTLLISDLAFLQHAPSCIKQLEQQGSTELALKLTLAYKQKKEQLPARIWQATLGGNEFRSFWNTSQQQLGEYPKNTNSQIESSLKALLAASKKWLSGDYRYNTSDLEKWLFEIKQGDGGSLLIASIVLQDQLHEANQILIKRLNKNPLCLGGRPHPRGDRFFAVVRRYFITEIQSWAASVNARYYQLAPPIIELEKLLIDSETTAYHVWRSKRDLQLKHLQQAPKNHVSHLKPLFKQCGLLPSVK